MASIRQSTTDPIPLPPGSSQVTILLADSDERLTRNLSDQLQAGGYTVLIATDFQQTFQLVDHNYPDIILLGEQVCDVDGRWICHQIKADDSIGFIPVIMLANQAAGTQQEDDTSFAPEAVLAKPIDRDELLQWLKRLIRIKRQIDRPSRRRAIQTQELNLLKSDIITNVSHELRTPMVQIKAAVSLLNEDIQAHGTPEQFRIANMATQAVARLENEIENIRQLAQTHQIRITPVMVSEAADLAIRHLERNWTSREGSGRVEKQLDPELPPIWADKRGLGRLLQLLLDNALKFSADDSPVYISGGLYDTSQVWIGVQDFGIGIPEDEHASIFQAFYQIDGSSTRSYGGTGTGLALAVLLASGMNTTIQLESSPGEGSTFSFLLPIADPDDLDTAD